MFNKLIVLTISLKIALFISGCGGEQTPEVQMKTNISKMIHLLEKKEIKEFANQYSYSEMFKNMNDEESSKMDSEKLSELIIEQVTTKLIGDLKSANNMSPKFEDSHQSATFYIQNQTLKFIKIDGVWRLDLDTYISAPSTAPFVYTLF